jgi:hypothetical protein
MRMTIKKTVLTLSSLLMCLTAISGEANNLSATDGGKGVYDSATNITWTADANLLGTKEAGNSSLIDTIVSDEAVAISKAYGGHSLTASDFGAGGLVNWYAAQAYVDYLNKIDYGNSNQWSLPTTPDNSFSAGYNLTTSQLGELFYQELGGTAGSSIPSNSLFTNEQAYGYWSATGLSSGTTNAWYFSTAAGLQGFVSDGFQLYAWAVSPGDLTAVPEPEIISMFALGLFGLSLAIRKKA